MTKQKLGFIGLGHMGLQMTLRLLETGAEIYVFDLTPECVSKAADAGAHTCISVQDVANKADLVCLSLPNAKALQTVTHGLLGGTACRYVLDLSTVGAAASKCAAELLSENGLQYIEAPVSGGPAKCRSGTLSIMVAGRPEDIEAASDVLTNLASKQTFVGTEPGLAQAMKLVNNHVALAQFGLISEGLVLAKKMGIDSAIATEILSAGVARNFVLEGPVPEQILNRKFAYGFAVDLTLKDLYLANEMAKENGVETPFGDAAIACYERTQNELGATSDVTSVIIPMERHSGVTVGREA
ncbi:3-hydroxyisobutyrate dehydrogenase-like beta-hydroxyacid dehydrogenase [Pseudomonas tolaasii]